MKYFLQSRWCPAVEGEHSIEESLSEELTDSGVASKFSRLGGLGELLGWASLPRPQVLLEHQISSFEQSFSSVLLLLRWLLSAAWMPWRVEARILVLEKNFLAEVGLA